MLKGEKKKREMNPMQREVLREFMTFFWVSIYILIIAEVVVLVALLLCQIIGGSVGQSTPILGMEAISPGGLSRWWDLLTAPFVWLCVVAWVGLICWANYLRTGNTLNGSGGYGDDILSNGTALGMFILGGITFGIALLLTAWIGFLSVVSVLIWVLAGNIVTSAFFYFLGPAIWDGLAAGYNFFVDLANRR